MTGLTGLTGLERADRADTTNLRAKIEDAIDQRVVERVVVFLVDLGHSVLDQSEQAVGVPYREEEKGSIHQAGQIQKSPEKPRKKPRKKAQKTCDGAVGDASGFHEPGDKLLHHGVDPSVPEEAKVKRDVLEMGADKAEES